jgi:glycosyltransferase involved in cell wall biosynthesis
VRLAISAISYIEKRDGISVYVENLTLALVREFMRTKERVEVIVFACNQGGQTLKALWEMESRVQETQNVDIQFIIAKTNHWYSKYVRLPYLLWKNGPYRYTVLPNMQPLLLVGGPRLSVLHDLTYKVAAGHFSKTRRAYLEVLTRFRIWADDAVGYISESTKTDLVKYYPSSTKKSLFFLPNGIPHKILGIERPPREMVERKLLAEKIELLYVGRINRLKGFDLVREICRFVDRKMFDVGAPFFSLHVVGKQTREGQLLIETLACRNLEVTVHGHVEDHVLNALYQRCAFCLFLSRNEGFGLPVIESLWFGCVPVLSSIPIFLEVMGNGFSFFSSEKSVGKDFWEFMKKLRGDACFRRETLNRMDRALQRHGNGYETAASFIANLCRQNGQLEESLREG